MWTGLNPYIADEVNLDNTLRRIREFSTAAGFNSFYMANLFMISHATRIYDNIKIPVLAIMVDIKIPSPA